MAEVKVVFSQKMQFIGRDESGFEVVMDTTRELGGDESGITPIELLLVSLGGCTAMDVIQILRKKRQDVTAYQVNVYGERRQEHPRVFTYISIEHVVHGKKLDPKAVERAVELSSQKYCSISAMLRQVTHVEHTYRIENGG